MVWIDKIIQKVMFPTRKYLDRKFRENEERLSEQFNQLLSAKIKEQELWNAQIQSIGESIKKLNESVKYLKNETQNFQKIINMQAETLLLIQEQGEEASWQELSEIKTKVEKEFKKLSKNLELANRTTEDVNWAEVFHDTIIDSSWLINKTFSPGRWAAGYQMLYVIYRILDEIQPQDILELGMGQSTKLIAQYSHYFKANHTIVEHDVSWLEKCKEDYDVLEQANITILELDTTAYRDDPEVLIYKNFKERVGNKKYDFICIDAPFGGGANKYARIDVLDLISDCLNEDFIILLDDYNRVGEKNTGELIKEKLEECGIAYEFGNYQGKKFTCVFTSESYKFLTTL